MGRTDIGVGVVGVDVDFMYLFQYQSPPTFLVNAQSLSIQILGSANVVNSNFFNLLQRLLVDLSKNELMCDLSLLITKTEHRSSNSQMSAQLSGR